MDDARRKQLEAKRAALKADLQTRDQKEIGNAFAQRFAIVASAIRSEGGICEFVDLWTEPQNWLPGWIPSGWGKVPWHLAPCSDFATCSTDAGARTVIGREFLERRANPDLPVLIIFKRDWAAVRTSKQMALRFMKDILSAATDWDEIWIGAPDHNWLIQFDFEGVRAVWGLPPTSQDLARARYFRRAGRCRQLPMLTKFAAAGGRYRLRYPPDPEFDPESDREFQRRDWKTEKPKLSMAVPADREERDNIVRTFIAEQVTRDALVLFRHYDPGMASHWIPDMVIRRRDIDSHIGILLDEACRPCWFTAPGATWLIEINLRWIYART